jgi:hypothetical protein
MEALVLEDGGGGIGAAGGTAEGDDGAVFGNVGEAGFEVFEFDAEIAREGAFFLEFDGRADVKKQGGVGTFEELFQVFGFDEGGGGLGRGRILGQERCGKREKQQEAHEPEYRRSGEFGGEVELEGAARLRSEGREREVCQACLFVVDRELRGVEEEGHEASAERIVGGDEETGLIVIVADLVPGFDRVGVGREGGAELDGRFDAEELACDVGGLAGAKVGAGEDERRPDTGAGGEREDATEFLDSLIGEGAVFVGLSGAAVFGDSVAKEVKVHRSLL